ncbi:hypothetical protein [Pedobacter frigidisoli]|uniref:hypothetical protein n=1 Tax=Pedobacter frigidisoli TaxID=2530455 RepID=UPI0029306F56|nr:hypothetical protein [Pedobacter frigidisoli]
MESIQDKVTPLGTELEVLGEMIAKFAAQSTPPYVILASPDKLENLFVMPRLIMCLAQNMYKHGDLTKAEYPGLIRIEHHLATLRITTKNLIRPNRLGAGFYSGMDDLRKRLAYTYGGAASMETWSDGKFFEVRVVIW